MTSMLQTMNIILTTCVMATLLSSGSVANAMLCVLETIKQSANKEMLGGWRSADRSNDGVVKLMQDAVMKARTASDDALPLTQHRDVIEAYTQVVNGVNFCIRFSASGNCGNYHCKSYECTASGHRSLQSNDLTDVEVQCETFTECDIDGIRENSKKHLMGGWFNAPLDNERVRKLYETSSRLAAVELGSVTEAYYQVVRGQKYCIQYTSHSSGNCGNNCQPLRCVAGGFYPIPDGNVTVNSEIATEVGVNCQPQSLRAVGKYGSSGDSSIGSHLSATVLTILIAVFICFMFE